MKPNLEIALQEFFNQYHNPMKPLLLGLSGGPDSLCLFYLLLQMNVPFQVAHIDHSWRKESSSESHILSNLCEKNKVPFHLLKLDPSKFCGNLEETCRNERLNFYRQLCKKNDFQAVILGHHADDLTETVLKRFFEGASFSSLFGMQERVQVDGVCVWRPLLFCKKEAILAWLKERNYEPFWDSTNDDPKFLRARCRSAILPFLSENFGKEIFLNLCRASQESIKLKEYLDRQISSYMGNIKQGKLGLLLDLGQNHPTEIIEYQHLLKEICRKLCIQYTHAFIENLAHLLINGVANKHLKKDKHVFYVDRKRLFISQNDFSIFEEEKVPLVLGIQQFKGLSIHVEEIESSALIPPGSWQDFLHGKMHLFLPANADYWLNKPIRSAKHHSGKTLNRWWTQQKVPAFLRDFLPIIEDQQAFCHDFLSGSASFKSLSESKILKVELEFSSSLLSY